MSGRPYLGAGDLAGLLRFGSRSFARRFPLSANWHPGDFVWELRGGHDEPQPIWMWDDASGVVAVGWMTEPGKLWLETLPEHEDLVGEMVAWGEALAAPTGLSVRAFDSDTVRIRGLEQLGYRRTAPQGVFFRMNLASPSEVLEPPLGFRVLDSIGIDPERRAAAHRDAWNDLGRIGLPDVRSTFSAALYLSLRAARAQVYDPTLDLLVEGPDGALVANAVCWADPVSGVGVFEPVGTHAAFRGRGLARLAILEGCRRLRRRGHRWARVGTAHFNAPAISAYLSCGFELYDRASWWTKSSLSS